MSWQCPWRMPGYHHLHPNSKPLWCIREAGHEGPHKNYTGRWDSSAEFKSEPSPRQGTGDRDE